MNAYFDIQLFPYVMAFSARLVPPILIRPPKNALLSVTSVLSHHLYEYQTLKDMPLISILAMNKQIFQFVFVSLIQFHYRAYHCHI